MIGVTSDPTEVVSQLNRAEQPRAARQKGTVTLGPLKIVLPGKVRNKRVMRISTLPKAIMPAVKRVPTSLKTAMKPTTMEARLNDPALQSDTVQPLLGHKRSRSETLTPNPIKGAVPEEDATCPEQAQQQLDTSTPTLPVGVSAQRKVQQDEIWDLFSVGLLDAHRDDDSMQEAMKVMNAAEVRDGFRRSHDCDGLSTFNQECKEMKIPTQLREGYHQWLLDQDRPHTNFTQM